jgi:hypothetical protein
VSRSRTCFFVDDNIINKASNDNCVVLQNILALYEGASGTAIFFSHNTSVATRENIVNFFWFITNH